MTAGRCTRHGYAHCGLCREHPYPAPDEAFSGILGESQLRDGLVGDRFTDPDGHAAMVYAREIQTTKEFRS